MYSRSIQFDEYSRPLTLLPDPIPHPRGHTSLFNTHHRLSTYVDCYLTVNSLLCIVLVQRLAFLLALCVFVFLNCHHGEEEEEGEGG